MASYAYPILGWLVGTVSKLYCYLHGYRIEDGWWINKLISTGFWTLLFHLVKGKGRSLRGELSWFHLTV